jgi:glycerol-3-phosphate dehydrogenase (NAD(P)+)
MSESVAVIGGGAWGLALAASAARAGSRVLVHSRRALDGALPTGTRQVRDFADVGREARIVVLAVPSTVAHEVARKLGDHIDGSHYVIHGVRGLAGATMDTISDIVRKETPARRLGALGGPALSEDLLAGRPSMLVVGSSFPEVNQSILDAFVTPTLRVYATDDLRGLEWASALVGCLAIAVGFAQGAGMSAGLVAGLIARSISEAGRLAAAAGGDERTLYGLAGYGDLLASIAQSERPEVVFGRALASGKSREQALAQIKEHVEAVELVPRVAAFAERFGVRAPIFRALSSGALEGRGLDAIVGELMTLPVEDKGI